jgi:hypothetical protein
MEIVIRENGGVDVLEGNSSWRKDVGIGLEKEVVVKSKILTHIIKGKIYFMPMETILMILRELEYLKGLVKLTRRQKDDEHKIIPTNVVA